MSERVFMRLPRECFVLHCKTVEHRFRKSRFADRKIHSHTILLRACSFVSHPFPRTAQRGILILDVASANIPSWHGLCLSRIVIASAATLLLC